MVDRANRAIRQARTTGTQPPSQDRRCSTDRRQPPGRPPAARRDRSQARLAAGVGDAAALNGAAVLAILRRRKWLLLASIAALPAACLRRDHAAHAALHRHRHADLRRERVQGARDAEHPAGRSDHRRRHGHPGGGAARHAGHRAGRQPAQPAHEPGVQHVAATTVMAGADTGSDPRMLFASPHRIRQTRCPGHGWNLPAMPR